MKRLILITLLCLTLTGCREHPKNIEDGLHWLETVDRNGDYYIVRHRQTGVCYLVSKRGLVMLVNTDGTPYTMGSNDGS